MVSEKSGPKLPQNWTWTGSRSNRKFLIRMARSPVRPRLTQTCKEVQRQEAQADRVESKVISLISVPPEAREPLKTTNHKNQKRQQIMKYLKQLKLLCGKWAALKGSLWLFLWTDSTKKPPMDRRSIKHELRKS